MGLGRPAPSPRTLPRCAVGVRVRAVAVSRPRSGPMRGVLPSRAASDACGLSVTYIHSPEQNGRALAKMYERAAGGRACVPLSAAASYCGRCCCAYCVSAQQGRCCCCCHAARALLLLLPRSKAAAAAASCSHANDPTCCKARACAVQHLFHALTASAVRGPRRAQCPRRCRSAHG